MPLFDARNYTFLQLEILIKRSVAFGSLEERNSGLSDSGWKSWNRLKVENELVLSNDSYKSKSFSLYESLR